MANGLCFCQIIEELDLIEVDGNEVDHLDLPASLEEVEGFPMETYHDEPSATPDFVLWLEVRISSSA
jgi:hypothetical protein